MQDSQAWVNFFMPKFLKNFRPKKRYGFFLFKFFVILAYFDFKSLYMFLNVVTVDKWKLNQPL